jgi:hypothetical protein
MNARFINEFEFFEVEQSKMMQSKKAMNSAKESSNAKNCLGKNRITLIAKNAIPMIGNGKTPKLNLERIAPRRNSINLVVGE